MFQKYRESRTGGAGGADAAAPSGAAPGAGRLRERFEDALAAPAAPAAAGPGDGAAQPVEATRTRRRKLAEIRRQAHARLLETLNLSALDQATEAEIKSEIAAVIRELVPKQSIVLGRSDREQLVDHLYYEVMGLGPLEILLKDESVSDILINGPEQTYVEQNGILELTDVQFQDEAHLRRILQKIVSTVGRRLDESTPYVDARLPDGSRLNAMIPPIALDGTVVSIRKFRKDKLSLEQLGGYDALTGNMAA